MRLLSTGHCCNERRGEPKEEISRTGLSLCKAMATLPSHGPFVRSLRAGDPSQLEQLQAIWEAMVQVQHEQALKDKEEIRKLREEIKRLNAKLELYGDRFFAEHEQRMRQSAEVLKAAQSPPFYHFAVEALVPPPPALDRNDPNYAGFVPLQKEDLPADFVKKAEEEEKKKASDAPMSTM